MALITQIFQFIDSYWWMLVALFAYYFILQPFLLTIVRQRLFELRTDLFCFAKEDNIEFSDEVYQESSKIANGLIQFHRHFTISMLIGAYLSDTQGAKDFINKIDQLEHQQKQKFTLFFKQIVKYAFLTLLINSPILSLLVIILSLLHFTFTMNKNLFSLWKKRYEEKAVAAVKHTSATLAPNC